MLSFLSSSQERRAHTTQISPQHPKTMMGTRTLAVAVLLLGCVGTATAVGYVQHPIFVPRSSPPTLLPQVPSGGSRFDLNTLLPLPLTLPPPPSRHARTLRTRRELKVVDYGEVVAAEHYKVEGGVAMGMMPGVRTSDVKITLVGGGTS